LLFILGILIIPLSILINKSINDSDQPKREISLEDKKSEDVGIEMKE
jgi:hypothetical protein